MCSEKEIREKLDFELSSAIKFDLLEAFSLLIDFALSCDFITLEEFYYLSNVKKAVFYGCY